MILVKEKAGCAQNARDKKNLIILPPNNPI